MSDVAADMKLTRDYPALSESLGKAASQQLRNMASLGGTPHVETVLQPGELIVRIRVPVTPVGRASTYHKIRDRESYAFVRNNGDPAPVDTMGAQYSIPYCAAVALLADPEDPAMFSDA